MPSRAKSGRLVLPRTMAPTSSRRCVTSALASGTDAVSARAPPVVGSPVTSMLSLTTRGTQWNASLGDGNPVEAVGVEEQFVVPGHDGAEPWVEGIAQSLIAEGESAAGDPAGSHLPLHVLEGGRGGLEAEIATAGAQRQGQERGPQRCEDQGSGRECATHRGTETIGSYPSYLRTMGGSPFGEGGEVLGVHVLLGRGSCKTAHEIVHPLGNGAPSAQNRRQKS